MKDYSSTSPDSLGHDLLMSLLLLTVSVVGGWFAWEAADLTGSEHLHLRLLVILLIHPFAIAAWLFCGLPGVGLALKSLFGAMEQRKAVAGLLSTGLLALSLASALLWV